MKKVQHAIKPLYYLTYVMMLAALCVILLVQGIFEVLKECK